MGRPQFAQVFALCRCWIAIFHRTRRLALSDVWRHVICMSFILFLSLASAVSSWDGPCTACNDADGSRLRLAWASSATTDEQKNKMRDIVQQYTRDGQVDWHQAAEEYFRWRAGPIPPRFNEQIALQVAKNAVRSRLVDPDSAQFSWRGSFFEGWWKPFLTKRISGYIACGDVNAKNRMGGYTGASAFVVVLNISNDVLYLDMDSSGLGLVDAACSKSGYTRTNNWDEATSPVAQSSVVKNSLADELTKLAALRDRGVLTQAEFEAQKAKLLNR